MFLQGHIIVRASILGNIFESYRVSGFIAEELISILISGDLKVALWEDINGLVFFV